MEALGIDAGGTILLGIVTSPKRQTTITIAAGRMENLGSRMTTVSPGSAVVAREEGQAIIVVQGDAQQVVAFEAPEGEGGSLGSGRSDCS